MLLVPVVYNVSGARRQGFRQGFGVYCHIRLVQIIYKIQYLVYPPRASMGRRLVDP
jgi:hypothetical protein